MSEATLREIVAAGETVHLMGVGGVGMAGLGLLLRARGAVVTGCDRAPSDVLDELRASGVRVGVGHSPEHAEGCDALIHSAAIPEDDPELATARARGIPVLKRSRALGELVNGERLVAVAGTHGKTTTTAVTALALAGAGWDPTALVGGRVPEWRGNARVGLGAVYVVEADEYDRSFLHLRPTIAVVTSVEPEHLDTYGTVEEMEAAFDRFVDRVPEDGRVIACVDDPGASRRLDRAGSRGLGYGLSASARLRGTNVRVHEAATRFEARLDDDSLGEFTLRLHGRHNVLNALAALGVLIALDVDVGAAADALASFEGVDRRFQIVGEAEGITVVDDYAHHPTEVAATLEAARTAFPGRRLVVAFQPHLYTRTRVFADRFGAALAAADRVYVADIYPARERPIPGVTADLVSEAARASMSPDRVDRVVGPAEAVSRAVEELRSGDVFITLGAGDIGSAASGTLSALERRHVEA